MRPEREMGSSLGLSLAIWFPIWRKLCSVTKPVASRLNWFVASSWLHCAASQMNTTEISSSLQTKGISTQSSTKPPPSQWVFLLPTVENSNNTSNWGLKQTCIQKSFLVSTKLGCGWACFFSGLPCVLLLFLPHLMQRIPVTDTYNVQIQTCRLTRVNFSSQIGLRNKVWTRI